MLKIGISACFFHADPQRAIFKGMTLQYIEQNVAHWLMQRDVLAFMVPSPEGRTKRAGSKATVDAYAAELDGVVIVDEQNDGAGRAVTHAGRSRSPWRRCPGGRR